MRLIKHLMRPSFRFCSYVQGQSPQPKVREYFYYIDHHGQLFLDDARMKNFTSCFKDKEFLAFFFKRLKSNKCGRYEDHFPYLSLCGPERNFIRCDDVPIVYTEIIRSIDGNELFSYCSTGDKLTVPFDPSKLCMLPQNGRIYYPAADIYGGIGLVKSGLAIELSKCFNFENGEEHPPTQIKWKKEIIRLTNELITKYYNKMNKN